MIINFIFNIISVAPQEKSNLSLLNFPTTEMPKPCVVISSSLHILSVDKEQEYKTLQGIYSSVPTTKRSGVGGGDNTMDFQEMKCDSFIRPQMSNTAS